MRGSATTALLIGASSLFAHVGWMPLTDRELSKRFPLAVIEDPFYCPAPEYPLVTRFAAGIRVRVGGPSGDLVFSGKDSSGNRWSVHVNPNMGGTLYRADLDRDGQQDLIYAAATGGNGMAPPSTLFFLLRDREGRPVAIKMEGYFRFGRNGIVDLLDLDGDGRAEVIRQDYDDGYWVTSPYEFRASRARLVRGRHGGREFPLYTRFLEQGRRQADRPRPNRHPRETDLSNAVGASAVVKLAAFRFDQKAYRYRISTVEGETFCIDRGSGTAMVTVDSRKERRSVVIRVEDRAEDLLRRIVAGKFPVLLAGQRYERDIGEGCVESIWAMDPR